MDLGLDLFKADYPKGIDGHQIKAITADDGGTAPGGVGVANEFVSDHVAAAFYLSDDSTINGLQADVLEKAHIPNFEDLGEDQFANVHKYPYVFPVDPSTAQYADAAAAFMIKRHLTRVGVLNDGLAADDQSLADLKSAVRGSAVKVVKEIDIPPNTPDASTAVQQLKAADPDIVYVDLGEGFGAIWDSFITQGYLPTIMASAGALYSGYTALGSLGPKAYTANFGCVPKGTVYPAYVVSAMKQYQALEGFQAGAMAALQNIISKVYLLDYAVSKYRSDSPAAIRQALETMGTQDFWWKLKFHITPTDHFGLLAPLGANVCAMSPLGQFNIANIAT
jgi:ABC-type branched-subunit amino acid transport system substrate-binding protein